MTSLKSLRLRLICIIALIVLNNIQVWALNVVQWQDSMQIMPNHYIDIYNENEDTMLLDKDTALRQTFSIDLNNNFINTLFDIIVFDPSDE